MRDGEDLLGRAGSALLVVQDCFSLRAVIGFSIYPATGSKRTIHGRIKRIVSGFVRIRSRTLPNPFLACARRESSLKRCYEIMGGGHFKLKTQIPNINMVRSAWRRIKKDIKDAIIRDLKPIKDVKGGGRVAGESKTTRGEGTRRATGDH